MNCAFRRGIFFFFCKFFLKKEYICKFFKSKRLWDCFFLVWPWILDFKEKRVNKKEFLSKNAFGEICAIKKFKCKIFFKIVFFFKNLTLYGKKSFLCFFFKLNSKPGNSFFKKPIRCKEWNCFLKFFQKRLSLGFWRRSIRIFFFHENCLFSFADLSLTEDNKNSYIRLNFRIWTFWLQISFCKFFATFCKIFFFFAVTRTKAEDIENDAFF